MSLGERCPHRASHVVVEQQYCAFHYDALRLALRSTDTVYFVARDGLIKIGVTGHLEKRVAALRGRLLATEDGGAARERELHLLFMHNWERNEWFRPAPDLLEYLRRRHRLATSDVLAALELVA